MEEATAAALKRRRNSPTLCGIPSGHTTTDNAVAVYADQVGYVQHLDVAALQVWANDQQCRLVVEALPGTFASPDRPLALIVDGGDELDASGAISAFEIGSDRLFDDDPRLGLVVLSEIAARALSPAVNDPGTAIDIIGTLVRLFSYWAGDPETPDDAPIYDRVEVPAMRARDMFDDAFTAIARDGAACVEVGVRLQKALTALASLGDADMREAAVYHADMAIKRAEKAVVLGEDLQAVRDARSL